jgi:hypothetical protein
MVDESWTSARTHLTGGGYEDVPAPNIAAPPFNHPIVLQQGSCNHRFVLKFLTFYYLFLMCCSSFFSLGEQEKDSTTT